MKKITIISAIALAVTLMTSCGSDSSESSGGRYNYENSGGSNPSFRHDGHRYVGEYYTYSADGSRSKTIYVYKTDSGRYYAKFSKNSDNTYTVYDASYPSTLENYIMDQWGYTYYFTL